MTDAHEHRRARPPGADGPSASYEPPPLQLSLPGFDGPIELLLRLTERDQFDITTVSLLTVTTQYLQHFQAQPWADAVALGDFVAIAARLLLLKSRRLLPRTGPAAAEDPQDEAEEEELLSALNAYQAFRQAAAAFEQRASAGSRLFPRVVPEPPEIELPLKKVPVEQLILVLQQALARFPQPEPAIEIPRQAVSIEEKVDEIRSRLRRDGVVGFLTVIERCRSRLEVVVCFIAVLHLIRDEELIATQSEAFGEIRLAPHASEG